MKKRIISSLVASIMACSALTSLSSGALYFSSSSEQLDRLTSNMTDFVRSDAIAEIRNEQLQSEFCPFVDEYNNDYQSFLTAYYKRNENITDSASFTVEEFFARKDKAVFRLDSVSSDMINFDAGDGAEIKVYEDTGAVCIEFTSAEHIANANTVRRFSEYMTQNFDVNEAWASFDQIGKQTRHISLNVQVTDSSGNVYSPESVTAEELIALAADRNAAGTAGFTDMIDTAAETRLNTINVLATAGDADSNGSASVSDIVSVLQFSANAVKYPIDAQGKFNCDMNSDGDVNAIDAHEIQEMISK